MRRLIVCMLLAAGCGEAGPPAGQPLDVGGADGQAVASAVEDLNDATAKPKKFADAFAKGAAGDMKKFAGLAFYLVGRPTVTGSEATAKVSVRRLKDESEVGQVDWAFAKEGDKWKIKSAPLPAGK